MRNVLLILFIGMSVQLFAQKPCTAPTVTITGTSWILKGITDTLTAHGPVGTSYIWNNGTTDSIYVTGPIDADSIFYVVATKAGCSDTAKYYVKLRNPDNGILSISQSG